MRRLILVVAALAPLWTCSDRPEAIPEASDDSSALVRYATPVDYRVLDTLDLYMPSSMQPTEHGMVLTEPPSGQVIWFDAATHMVRRFGRRGQGPGELRHPVFAVVRDSIVFVVDVGNRRISEFMLDTGKPIRQVRLDYANFFASIAVDNEGSLLFPGTNGQPRIFRLLGDSAVPLTDEDTPKNDYLIGFSMLLQGPNELVLIDPDGTIRRLAEDGTEIRRDSLPKDIRTTAVETVIQARGQPPSGDQPLVKAASVGSDGTVTGMLVGKPDGILGFQLTPDGHFIRIRAGAMNGAALDALRSAAGVVTQGDTLVVAHQYGVATFRLSADAGGARRTP